MSNTDSIMFRLFVKPFYKENAGVFVFIFTMMFFIVSEQSSAGLYEYHYYLCIGMLSNNIFLFSVFFVWALYAIKNMAFVSRLIAKPEYGFCSVYNSVGKFKRLRLFLVVQIWLMLPILAYSIFVFHCGLKGHFYTALVLVFLFLLALCILPAIWYVHLLTYQQKLQLIPAISLRRFVTMVPAYLLILVQFVATEQKKLWIGLKLYSCGIVYLISRNEFIKDSDEVGQLFIFFNFGILAHAVLIYRIRAFEQENLLFYRGLAVSLLKRFSEYALLYLFLLVPEIITLLMLSPEHLEITTAVCFALCGYGLLLLLNSITFIRYFPMNDFLKILLLIFCIQLLFLNTVGLVSFCLSCFILAVVFFVMRYYQFERMG